MARARLRRFFRHGFLPQLMAFEAVVRHGSVTRAAEELCLAQPTVSCMLRKLSDAVGGPVTVMRLRRIEPTPLGSELLTLCQDMVQAMERFEERQPAALKYDHDGDAGTPEGTLGAAPPSGTGNVIPWPSLSPSVARSRWRQRASQCPRAKRRLDGADGVS